MREHPIACFSSVRSRLEEFGLGANVRHVTNSGTALRRIIDEGTVIGPLPRSIAEAKPPLRLCFPVPVESAIWLTYPERLRRKHGRQEHKAEKHDRGVWGRCDGHFHQG